MQVGAQLYKMPPLRIALVAVVFTLGFTGVLRAQTKSLPNSPEGHFEGTAISRQAGKINVSLDLTSKKGHYTGQLVTPGGTYIIEDGHADANKIQMLLKSESDAKVIVEVVYDVPTLRGTFTATDDGGPLELRRTGNANIAAAGNGSNLSKQQWHQDLQFLAEELPKRHANAFHFISRGRFVAEITRLDQRMDTLNPDEIYVGMDQIVNLIGDGHTYIKPPVDDADLPIDIERFGDEYRVVAVADGNEDALGARVLRVQNISVDQACKNLLSLTPADERQVLRDLRVSSFLTTGVYLHGARIISNRNVAHYILADNAGKDFAINVHAVAARKSAKLKWKYAFKKRPLFRQKPGNDFWYIYLADAHAIYCSFRGYADLAVKSPGLFTLIKQTRPGKVVIDMRLNGGGDYNDGLKYMINPLRNLSDINQKNHLFVLVGPSTFSAAMSNAAQFRSQTNALLVGEQIGEKPNSYQEAREMTLPNSGWTVRYSVKFYRFVDHGENVIRPDKEIIPSWDDYRFGRDPVLGWVLNFSSSKVKGPFCAAAVPCTKAHGIEDFRAWRGYENLTGTGASAMLAYDYS